jgi:putative FmdB family regulatory protein
MPLYDYDCAQCGRRFEIVHGVHAEGPTACPLCGGGPVRKAISAPTVHFKGSGWAKRDRRSAATASSKAATDGAGDASEEAPAASKAKTGTAKETASASTDSATSKEAGTTASKTD